MKRTIALVALALAAVACNGGGGSADTRGEVIDKAPSSCSSGQENCQLKIKGVVSHNQVIWWERVNSRVWNNCEIGETWDQDNSDGCN